MSRVWNGLSHLIELIPVLSHRCQVRMDRLTFEHVIVLGSLDSNSFWKIAHAASCHQIRRIDGGLVLG